MSFGEEVEIVAEHLAGRELLGGARQAVNLQQQAVAEVGRAYSGGVEGAGKVPHAFHGRSGDVEPLGHEYVVGYCPRLAGEVAVVVEVPYDMAGGHPLRVGEFELLVDLPHKRLVEGLAVSVGRYRGVGVLEVGPPPECVAGEEVVGHVVVGGEVGPAQLLRGLGEFGAVLGEGLSGVFGGIGSFERGHILDGPAHLFLDLRPVHLQQAHELHLLGSELLPKPLGLA